MISASARPVLPVRVPLRQGEAKCCACYWRPTGDGPPTAQADAHTDATGHPTVCDVDPEMIE